MSSHQPSQVSNLQHRTTLTKRDCLIRRRSLFLTSASLSSLINILCSMMNVFHYDTWIILFFFFFNAQVLSLFPNTKCSFHILPNSLLFSSNNLSFQVIGFVMVSIKVAPLGYMPSDSQCIFTPIHLIIKMRHITMDNSVKYRGITQNVHDIDEPGIPKNAFHIHKVFWCNCFYYENRLTRVCQWTNFPFSMHKIYRCKHTWKPSPLPEANVQYPVCSYTAPHIFWQRCLILLLMTVRSADAP